MCGVDILDIPLVLPPSDSITLDSYLGKGKQPDEELLPSEPSGNCQTLRALACLAKIILTVAGSSGPAQPEFNVEALSALEGMGFPLIRSQKALLATGNSDANAAMEWLFAHMEDAGTCSFLIFKAKTHNPSNSSQTSTRLSLLLLLLLPAEAQNHRQTVSPRSPTWVSRTSKLGKH